MIEKIGRYIFVPAILMVILISCGKIENKPAQNITGAKSEVWFKQASVDLGYRIIMTSGNYGAAISRGKGENVKGHALIFNNGIWQTIDDFDYSDFPQISFRNSKNLWYVIHETHEGSYRPRLYSFSNNIKKEIPLPKVMWDERDYSMWTGMAANANGKAWLVGQRGNIIFYNGSKWSQVESPVKENTNSNLLNGDLDDVQMLSDTSGWAVGKQGIILKYTRGKWIKFDSPTNDELKSISMADEKFGWIVGDRGTILNYDGGKWKIFPSSVRLPLNNIKTFSRGRAWAVGSRSTLIEFKNGNWSENNSIKIFEDAFNDIDVVKDSSGDFKIWIIGDNGIYSNSQSLKFSFTDITAQAALRKDGRAAILDDFNDDGLPEIMQLLEDGPSILSENLGNNMFGQISREVPSNKAGRDPVKINSQTISIGDIDNDGELDLIEILDDINYRMLFGRGGFDFRTVDEKKYLNLDYIQTDLNLTSSQLADFDNDGSLDLYVSNFNYTDMLFKNNGVGKFTNVFKESGIKKLINHRSYSTTLTDFNNDGLVDVFISYKVPENKQHLYLYLNQGGFKFIEKTDSNFYTNISTSTLSTIAKDFNNDGFTDLFIFNNEEESKLLLNNGDASFYNATESARLSEIFFHPEPASGIIAAADVNSDGWLDLFIGSKLFLCEPPGIVNKKIPKYYEIGKHVGVDFVGNPSFADIDNDGDIDLFVGSSRSALGTGDRAILYRNNLIQKNFIKVFLKPDLSNRQGIGTKIFLEALDSSNKIIWRQLKQVGLGDAAISQSVESPVNFGIDKDYNYRLRIIFPSGVENIIEQPEINSATTVYESPWLNHNLILIKKSLSRTLLLIDWKSELIKFLAMLFILIALYFYGTKTKASKLVKKWYLAFGFIIIYLLLVHLNIARPLLSSAFISIGLTGSFAAAFIFIAGAYYEKKESKYISHYKIVDIIGVGGMGKVFKAIDSHSGKIVAIKVLNPMVLKEEENKKRLSSEGRLLSAFEHPNIIKVFEFGETQKHTFIAMEYLSGGTLEEFIRNNFPLPREVLINIAKQICDGLAAIHAKNIVHRDLKSQNIMFDENGIIRIMDFGLSKSPLVSTMTSLGTVVGTLGYVAPEQITNIHVDQRTDVFSLGVVLYEMAANKLPFTGENEMALIHSIFNTVPARPSDINSSVPKSIDEIIFKCISKNPDERFDTADEIINAFNELNY